MWAAFADPEREYKRQGCDFGPKKVSGRRAHFKVFDNSQQSLCSTLPVKLVFPAEADLSTV